VQALGNVVNNEVKQIVDGKDPDVQSIELSEVNSNWVKI
jgi:hypothetical protein